MLLILFLSFSLALGCKISGFESGTCVSLNEVKNSISFCADSLSGDICVPEDHVNSKISS